MGISVRQRASRVHSWLATCVCGCQRVDHLYDVKTAGLLCDWCGCRYFRRPWPWTQPCHNGWREQVATEILQKAAGEYTIGRDGSAWTGRRPGGRLIMADTPIELYHAIAEDRRLGVLLADALSIVDGARQMNEYGRVIRLPMPEAEWRGDTMFDIPPRLDRPFIPEPDAESS